jgi:hypothetical protein
MIDAPNDGLPLTFMYTGKIYSKQVDGYYHIFVADKPKTMGYALDAININKARLLFTNAKFISSMIVLSDDVALKV